MEGKPFNSLMYDTDNTILKKSFLEDFEKNQVIKVDKDMCKSYGLGKRSKVFKNKNEFVYLNR